jgi:small subunit ribosomal protein S16
MSVRIRLRRIGRKKQPYYRVVVTDSRAPRDGAYLETVGFYNPRAKPAELRLSLERVDAWVADGAGLSETVASLVKKARKGGDRTIELTPFGAAPEKKQPRAAAPPPAEPAPVEAEPAPEKAEPAAEAEPAADAEAAAPAEAAAEPPAE